MVLLKMLITLECLEEDGDIQNPRIFSFAFEEIFTLEIVIL
jgi:hypothetical protein